MIGYLQLASFSKNIIKLLKSTQNRCGSAVNCSSKMRAPSLRFPFNLCITCYQMIPLVQPIPFQDRTAQPMAVLNLTINTTFIQRAAGRVAIKPLPAPPIKPYEQWPGKKALF